MSNRDGTLANLIRRPWQKAETIALVHEVTKNELGAAVPPCGRFGANAASYRLSFLTEPYSEKNAQPPVPTAPPLVRQDWQIYDVPLL